LKENYIIPKKNDGIIQSLSKIDTYNLKMQKGYSEDVYRRGTDNIMNQKKKDKWVNRALHRKL
jgi:hypothetical protein